MRNELKKTQRNRNERNKQWKYTGERRMQTVSRTHSAGDTKYSRSAIKKDEREIIEMQYCRWLMMDQCSSEKNKKKRRNRFPQKQGQNGFVGLGIPGCAAELDIIFGVTEFVIFFGNVQILF